MSKKTIHLAYGCPLIQISDFQQNSFASDDYEFTDSSIEGKRLTEVGECLGKFNWKGYEVGP